MMGIKPIIMLVIAIIITIALVPTVWSAIWDSALTDGGTACNKTLGQHCVNGTSATILKLVPLVFVGAFLIALVMLSE
jgi:hypothetical protein